MIDLEKIKSEKPIEELMRFGIINIDKPTGPTSFTVSQFICKSLGLNKTSHAGTLDPMVTGVLPILLGRTCRLSDYFMHKDKTYVGIMRLHENTDDKTLANIMEKFIGKITQLPPVRSRVKRAEREREVKSFKILEREGKDVLFETQVQAGTYIRKLIHDIGLEIGGAHMLELRRTKSGMFDESSLVNLYDFEKAVNEYKNGNEKLLREIITPAEIISQIIPSVEIRSDNLKKILTGKPLYKEDLKTAIPKAEKVAVFCEGKFIEIASVVHEGNIVAKPEFVFN